MPRRLATSERLNSPATRQFVHVVAGVVRDERGRILIAQRPPGKHLAGGWEFPGGKLHAGETRFEGLRRELREELGIETLSGHPLIRVRHRYPGRWVLLDVWIVTAHEGRPSGRDGQALRWCDVRALPRAGLLPADRPVVTALRLPSRLGGNGGTRYCIGDERASPGTRRLHGRFCSNLGEARRAVARGADFIVLERMHSPAAVAALCERIPIPVYLRGLSLGPARALGASGIYAPGCR